RRGVTCHRPTAPSGGSCPATTTRCAAAAPRPAATRPPSRRPAWRRPPPGPPSASPRPAPLRPPAPPGRPTAALPRPAARRARDDAGRHVILCRIVQDRLGDRVAISHQSASCAWGHDQWGWDMSVVHVTRLDAGATRLEAGIQHHRFPLEHADLVEVNGLWVP